MSKGISIWWGPPKEFNPKQLERRVSWLELFYDLVYVIAIARITHHLSVHLSLHGSMEYACQFTLIFWGWLNGSLHHDLHGNQGLRTRLMTLWQMMIIAALAIMLDRTQENYQALIIIFMIMQLFITYQWWSVGFYDKPHRRYNRPYTLLYLVSFFLMGIALFTPQQWFTWLLPIILVCNYLPPFIASRILKRSSLDLSLSSSMFERLGLFTIIVFGELVVGVVQGMSEIEHISFVNWLNFSLGISIVFALWWIFFTMVSRREARKGFNRASLLELLYIPTLISLGFIAACFPSIFSEQRAESGFQQLFGLAIMSFLCCVALLMRLLEYPHVFTGIKKPMQFSLLLSAVLFLVISFINPQLINTNYLLLILLLLAIEIIFLNYIYYSKLLKLNIDPAEV